MDHVIHCPTCDNWQLCQMPRVKRGDETFNEKVRRLLVSLMDH